VITRHQNRPVSALRRARHHSTEKPSQPPLLRPLEGSGVDYLFAG
jgi:hypothetical protein